MAASRIDVVFLPLDRARLVFFKALGPWAGKLAGDRSLRVAVLGVTGVLGSLLFASTVPLWLLLLSPIVLGVPHVVSDLRYLVVRRGLHRRPLVWVFAFAPLVLVAFDAGVLAGLSGAFGAIAISRTTGARRVVGLGSVALLFALAWWGGSASDVIFAHVHNGVAVLLFWVLGPRDGARLLPVALFSILGGAILLGALDPIVSGVPAIVSGTFSFAHVAASVAPNVAEPLAARLVLFFAFAQSVHYLVWLRLVPEDDRPQKTPRTFRASFHALRADLGTFLFVAATLAALAVAVWASVDLVAARDGYLRMALVHGHLELVALAFVFAEGRSYIMGSAGASSTRTASRGVFVPTSVRTGRSRSSRGAEA
jgi:hypothetical protein